MVIPEASPNSMGTAEVPLLRSAGHGLLPAEGSPEPTWQMLPPPCTHDLPCFWWAFFPASLHSIPRDQGPISTDNPAFFITLLTLMSTDFKSTEVHTLSISLTPWRVYHSASLSFIHIHLLSSPPPSFLTPFCLPFLPPFSPGI